MPAKYQPIATFIVNSPLQQWADQKTINWGLSAGENALVAIVHSLLDHADALDAHQLRMMANVVNDYTTHVEECEKCARNQLRQK